MKRMRQPSAKQSPKKESGWNAVLVTILVLLFAVLCIAMVTVFRQPSGRSGGFGDSSIIRQRIINIEKSR